MLINFLRHRYEVSIKTPRFYSISILPYFIREDLLFLPLSLVQNSVANGNFARVYDLFPEEVVDDFANIHKITKKKCT